MVKEGISGAEKIIVEPRIVNGQIVSVGQGPSGAPAGAHCPDALVRPQGAQGSVVGQPVSAAAQELADLKYGGGQAAAKYNAHGVPVRTINGVTNSANTDPALLQMAEPQKPPTAQPVEAATPIKPAVSGAEPAPASTAAPTAAPATDVSSTASKISSLVAVRQGNAWSSQSSYRCGFGLRRLRHIDQD